MERQQQIAYQLDLFSEQDRRAIYPTRTSQGVSEGKRGEGSQVTGAGKQERALTEDLMQHVCSPENIRKAYKRVKQNDGSAGVDSQGISSFGGWYVTKGETLRNELLTGKYLPDAVRAVEIPKPDGKGTRQLGIPTVRDRVIQQAIYQVLNPLFDGEFSESSYGFRERRKAIRRLRSRVNISREVIA